MATDGTAGEDLVERLTPPCQPDLGGKRLAGRLGRSRQFVVEGVEGDQVRARLGIGDEAAGEPTVRIDPGDQGVEVISVAHGRTRLYERARRANGGPLDRSTSGAS